MISAVDLWQNFCYNMLRTDAKRELAENNGDKK